MQIDTKVEALQASSTSGLPELQQSLLQVPEAERTSAQAVLLAAHSALEEQVSCF